MDRDTRTLPASYALSYVAGTAAVVVVACGGAGLVFRWIFSRQLALEYSEAFQALKSLHGSVLPVLALCGTAAFLIASPLLCTVAVFASHRIAGPLFRLQRVAEHLARGELVGQVHLRAADQCKPVAEEVNRFVAAHKERCLHLQECCKQLQHFLSSWEEDLASGASGGVEEKIVDMQSMIRELEQM